MRERWQRLLGQRTWLVPLASFVAGWASYALVERAAMVRWVAAFVLLGWIWILAEDVVGRWLERVSRGRLSPRLVRLATQSIHQETLFFALPFLFVATNWESPQALFTWLVIAAAIVSTIDPIYLGRIARGPISALAFHGLCAFVAALVVVPMALALPVEIALDAAFVLLLVFVAPGVVRWVAGPRWRDSLGRLVPVAATLAALWVARAGVPPAGLEVRAAVITHTVSAALVPGTAVRRLTAAAAAQRGVVAFVAIRAPQGLSQHVVFEWRRAGLVQDRVEGDIHGGREQGYRTWSRKHGFGAGDRGRWAVDIRTAQGQLIARLRFEVV